MARRSTANRELDDLARRIRRAYDDSPLEVVGEKLLEIVEGTVEAVRAGSARPNQDKNIVNYIRPRLDALPQAFGERFLVDAAIIDEIAREWSTGPVSFSSMIVPRYSQTWGHQSVDLAHVDGRRHIVNVILMPGDDDIRSIDLLDYPWLCHELGHNLHFRDQRFAEQFQTQLDKRLKSLRTRAIADRGSARARAMDQISQIESVWSPTEDHENWPCEIAVDLVALWVCGPAFLASFAHELAELQPPPYRVTQGHPPYDVRSAALIDAAQRLGWSEHVSKLEKERSRWSSSPGFAADNHNAYIALADTELITSTVTCGLNVCGEFRLPLATSETIDRLKDVVASPTESDFGSELMIAAWLAETELDDEQFDEWHKAVVQELHRAVTQESH